MKITVGMGALDDYRTFAEAGADEMFAGYVPEIMYRAFPAHPLNRREVRYVNVQLGSESELEILQDLVERRGIPVSITLNSLSYAPEQMPLISRIMEQCCSLGFHRFIIADPGLLVYLQDDPQLMADCSIHISGELGAMNELVLESCRRLGAERIIFHRKVSLAQMEEMIRVDRQRHPEKPVEYEAFLLNEMCHFHGGFCQSMHCDELAPMCRVPYRLDPPVPMRETSEYEGTGAGGCGLCALWRLRKMGVTHLKLVSRGGYSEDTVREIHTVRRALQILEASETEMAFLHSMKGEIFPSGCSGQCYYVDKLWECRPAE